MVIKIFLLHYCTAVLSSSCANCPALSVSNYSLPSAWPPIQPKMVLTPKKRSTHVISALTSKLAHILVRNMLSILHMLKYFRGARTY